MRHSSCPRLGSYPGLGDVETTRDLLGVEEAVAAHAGISSSPRHSAHRKEQGPPTIGRGSQIRQSASARSSLGLGVSLVSMPLAHGVAFFSMGSSSQRSGSSSVSVPIIGGPGFSKSPIPSFSSVSRIARAVGAEQRSVSWMSAARRAAPTPGRGSGADCRNFRSCSGSLIGGVSLRRRAVDGEDASRPAASPAPARHDDPLPRHPSSSRDVAGHATFLRAAYLPCHGSGDTRQAGGRRRPPFGAQRQGPDDDRRGAFFRLHGSGDGLSETTDEGRPKRSAALLASTRRRRRLLRLPARSNRGSSERDRAAPDPGLRLLFLADHYLVLKYALHRNELPHTRSPSTARAPAP
jgi:hypothetical protein